MLADHAFNKDGSFRYAENVDLGFRGDTILVNGAVAPRMAVQRRIYRLRFLNASNARTYDLRLGNGRQMLQIASDGGLLERPVARSAFPLHPAERIEVLIDFRSFRPGSQIVLQNTSGEATTKQVMRFDVVDGGGSEEARMPRGRMRTLEKLPEPNASAALGPLAASRPRASSGRSPTAASTPRASTSRRGWGRRSCGSGTTRPTACTRCTCTGCCSGSSSAPRASSTRASARWKDTIGVLPNETVTVQPWFTPVHRAATCSTATRSSTATRR